MIIPSQHASRVARAAAGGGGGNDVTPNAVNWNDVAGGSVGRSSSGWSGWGAEVSSGWGEVEAEGCDSPAAADEAGEGGAGGRRARGRAQ